MSHATMRYCTLLLLLATGCYDSADPAAFRIADVAVGDAFSLHVGERAFVPEAHLTVRLVGIVGDSRCPSNAFILCVWEGEGVIAVEIAPEFGDPVVDTLHTRLNPRATEFGPWVLEFRELAPYPYDVGPIPTEDYVATLAVRPGP